MIKIMLIAVLYLPPIGVDAAKKKKPAAEVDIPAAEDTQLVAAKEVFLGESSCEFGKKIKLSENAKYPGYLDLDFNRKKFLMKPIISPTGAVRLEDVKKEIVMIQIADKTMVMSQKTGQRLVDGCIHPSQKAAIPAPKSLL